jgi:hypothetical protein
MSDPRLQDLPAPAAGTGDSVLDDGVAADVARCVPLSADAADLAALAGRLAAHPSADVRLVLATNPTTPADVLDSLTRPAGRPPAQRCAGCTGTSGPGSGAGPGDASAEDAAPWCSGRHEDVTFMIHRAVAENPAARADTVDRLLVHPDMWVRCGVATRADLSADVHRRLADDPTPGVRGTLAENPAIGEPLIRAIAADPRTRRRLVRNPAVPLDLLLDLISTTDVAPALLPRIATATPDEVEQLAASPVAGVRMLLAHRPGLPAPVVDMLAAGVSADVTADAGTGSATLVALATQPNASPAVLRLCLADAGARPVAAGHPALPADLIAELRTDPDRRVREAAAANPSAAGDDVP